MTDDLPRVANLPAPRKRKAELATVAPTVPAVQERSRWLFAEHLDKLERILTGTFKQSRRKYQLNEDGQRVLVEEVQTEPAAREVIQALELLANYGGIPKATEVTQVLSAGDAETVERFVTALREPRVREMLRVNAPRIFAELTRNDDDVIDAEVIEVSNPQ